MQANPTSAIPSEQVKHYGPAPRAPIATLVRLFFTEKLPAPEVPDAPATLTENQYSGD